MLIDYPEGEVEEFDVPNFPNDLSKGSRRVPFSRVLYIDRSDFREEDDPKFKRLAPGKTVGLMHTRDDRKTGDDKAYRITCANFIKDDQGRVKLIEAICDRGITHKSKARAFIQWVAECPRHKSPVPAEVRLYSGLFKHEDPAKNPEGWLADVNPDSLEVKPAFVEVGLRNAKPEDHFQFLRLGYFTADKDSTKDKLVFNRTVTLKTRDS